MVPLQSLIKIYRQIQTSQTEKLNKNANIAILSSRHQSYKRTIKKQYKKKQLWKINPLKKEEMIILKICHFKISRMLINRVLVKYIEIKSGRNIWIHVRLSYLMKEYLPYKYKTRILIRQTTKSNHFLKLNFNNNLFQKNPHFFFKNSPPPITKSL